MKARFPAFVVLFTAALSLAGSPGGPASSETATLLQVSAGSSPKDTVVAFVKALQKWDFKTMAGLVSGGDTGFDYKQFKDPTEFLAYGWLPYGGFNRVEVKVKREKLQGPRGEVVCNITFYQNKVAGASYGDEVLPVEMKGGKWYITPNRSGGAFAFLAYGLTRPAEVRKGVEANFGRTRNLTPATQKLGRDRLKFFDQVLSIDRNSASAVPYSGYKSMTLEEHTNVIWPVGRSDELVFLLSGDNLLTSWKRVNGKPKRMWQVKIITKTGSGGKLSGTLPKWLDNQVPAKITPSIRATLRQNRAYAVYIESAAISTYYCWVVFKDGTQKTGFDQVKPMPFGQDSRQVQRQGFFITPDERALLKW